MSAMPPPFPPVVRWAVFPALAALAGATGGALAALAAEHGWFLWTAIAGSLGAGSAFSSGFERRPWLAFLVGPVLGALFACAAAFANGHLENGFIDVIRNLLREPQTLFSMASAVSLQTAAHLLALRRAGPARLGAIYGGAAVLAGSIAAAFMDVRGIATLFFLSTAAQVVALPASRALARRLQK